MKKIFMALFFSVLLLSGCKTTTEPQSFEEQENNEQIIAEEKNNNQNTKKTTEDKMCGWIDGSALTIKINLPEGYEQPSSFEAGLLYNMEGSTLEYKLAKVARKQCDYRVGLDGDQLQKIHQATVGVWGYDDNEKKSIDEGPIVLTFTDGVPDQGKEIEITLK